MIKNHQPLLMFVIQSFLTVILNRWTVDIKIDIKVDMCNLYYIESIMLI